MEEKIAVPSKKRTRRRWGWWCLIGLAVLAMIAVAPGPISGCYLETGDYFNTTTGYTFSYLSNGRAFSCNEYADASWEWGTYRFEPGIGWVVTLRGSNRRAHMMPHLLFIRFSDLDPGERPVTAPFQWRNPFVWRTAPVLRRLRPGISTNATPP